MIIHYTPSNHNLKAKFAIGHAKCCLFAGGHPLLSLLPGDTLVYGNLASGYCSPILGSFGERKFHFGHQVPLS
jgi:hypothetical protein